MGTFDENTYSSETHEDYNSQLVFKSAVDYTRKDLVPSAKENFKRIIHTVNNQDVFSLSKYGKVSF